MEDQRNGPVEERALPPILTEQMEISLGVSDPPTTLGELAEALNRLLQEMAWGGNVDSTRAPGGSHHMEWFDGELPPFRRALPPLLVPFMMEKLEGIRMWSGTPASDASIEISISDEDVDVSPEEAVISFGVAADVDEPAAGDIDPELAYSRFCPYVNAFTSQTEYEKWMRASPAAETVAVPIKDAYELARKQGERSFDR